MPRIGGARSEIGWKPGTRDKKKRQRVFQHEASLFNLADQMGKNFAKTLDDLIKLDMYDQEPFTTDTSFDFSDGGPQ